MVDFLDGYLAFTEDSEVPRIFHRWSCITSVSAALGRGIFLRHGNGRVFPNLYCMLIGEPATRKSTAIKLARKFLASAGYDKFAADRTSKEQFLLKLSGAVIETAKSAKSASSVYEDVTNINLWGDDFDKTPKEVFIAADEFNEFSGVNNVELFTTLGNMWDWDDESRCFEQEYKTARSVSIFQPTVTILGGNTKENFARAIPPEIIGGGFLSRLLLIHGKRSGRKITFPRSPSEEEFNAIVEILKAIQINNQFGEVTLTEEAKTVFDNIYQNQHELSDIRFRSYVQRRLVHLFKITLVLTAMRFERIIEPDTVVYANTLLTALERNMPTALGEFGKGKNSDVVTQVLEAINNTSLPISTQKLWASIGARNLDSIRHMTDILMGLQSAGKIQYVKAAAVDGWLPSKAASEEPVHVNYDLLTKEEKDMLT